jgi:hypothetical protein
MYHDDEGMQANQEAYSSLYSSKAELNNIVGDYEGKYKF